MFGLSVSFLAVLCRFMSNFSGCSCERRQITHDEDAAKQRAPDKSEELRSEKSFQLCCVIVLFYTP